MHPWQPSSEVFLPTLGQCRNSQRPLYRDHVGIAIPFFGVQTSDFRDWHAVGVPGNCLDLIAATHFSLARDGHVESRPAACKESLHHVVGLKSHTKFVAREARLRHDYFRRPDREPVAKADRIFQQTVGSEVLPKYAPRQLLAGQFSPPIIVVFERVAVDGLMLSPVNGEIRLPVAVQIKLSQSDAASGGLLVDRGSRYCSPPCDFAG